MYVRCAHLEVRVELGPHFEILREVGDCKVQVWSLLNVNKLCNKVNTQCLHSVVYSSVLTFDSGALAMFTSKGKHCTGYKRNCAQLFCLLLLVRNTTTGRSACSRCIEQLQHVISNCNRHYIDSL